MAAFKGQAEYSIDDKGRMALPAKMRRVLNPEAKETFVATRGPEQCLYLYPLDEWEQIENQMRTLNSNQIQARAYIRELLRWAEDLGIDGQGRVTLPKTLIEFAGLSAGNGSKAVILGALDHIEVWDPAVFDAYLNQQPDDHATITERVMGGTY